MEPIKNEFRYVICALSGVGVTLFTGDFLYTSAGFGLGLIAKFKSFKHEDNSHKAKEFLKKRLEVFYPAY